MAITTDADYVISIAPELAGSESLIETYIEVAKLSVDEECWDALANHATALLAAHSVTLTKRKGAGGDVKRKKIGDAEIEFQKMDYKNPHELNATSYGSEFLRLRRQKVITPMVTNC